MIHKIYRGRKDGQKDERQRGASVLYVLVAMTLDRILFGRAEQIDSIPEEERALPWSHQQQHHQQKHQTNRANQETKR